MIWRYVSIICFYISVLKFKIYSNEELSANATSVKEVFTIPKQSPINVKSLFIQTVNLSKLNIDVNWEREAIITNTGHTVDIVEKPSEQTSFMKLTNGPLKNDHVFAGLHFHWSRTVKCGSEHKLNGRCFPAEAHIVFRNIKFGSFKEAHKQRGGIAVIGTFIKVGKESSSHFQKFVDKMNLVRESKNSTIGSFSCNFKWITAMLTGRYISYSGSLTTFPHTEGVTWILFPKPFTISHSQLREFRNLRDNQRNPIVHNVRPIQRYVGQPIMTPSDSSPVLIRENNGNC